MATQKPHASTQKFTEIADIVDNVVLLQNGYACLVIEVTASNFALLSKKEQDSKIYAYASLLNSLTFPIQILIRNKRIDVSSYLKTLEEQEMKTQNPLLARQIRMYREFVHEMVKINVVLNKSFYIVISYSSLEAGVTGVSQAVGKGSGGFIEEAKKGLYAKADTVQAQLRRLAVASKVLEKEELVKLYYAIYNEDDLQAAQVVSEAPAPLVKAMP